MNYLLIIIFFALTLAYFIAYVLLKEKNSVAVKIFKVSGLILLVAFATVLAVVLPTKSDESEKYKPLSNWGIYGFSVLLVVSVAVLTIIFSKNEEEQSSTKSIAYAGICIALSFGLSFIKLFSLPQGGSITLGSMLPVLIYSYLCGAKKGIMVGIIYGALQFIQSPQLYHPMQVILDYPIAFGVLGLCGITKDFKIKRDLVKFIIGCVIAVTFRYCSHFLSGYYVFSSWAMEGYSALTWSLVYNLYVIVELAVVLALSVPLFSSKGFVKAMKKFTK